jgi:hypothetical protein
MTSVIDPIAGVERGSRRAMERGARRVDMHEEGEGGGVRLIVATSHQG